jgi:hypothetical protein
MEFLGLVVQNIGKLDNPELQEHRARDLLAILGRRKANRKRAFVAFKFSRGFRGIVKADFQMEALQILTTQGSNEGLLSAIGSKAIGSILGSFAGDAAVLCDLIFRLLSRVGTSLEKSVQTRLVAKLAVFAASDFGIPCELGFEIAEVGLTPPPFAIRARVVSATRGVFEYSPYEVGRENAIRVPIGFGLHLTLSLFNPYAVNLSLSLSIPDTELFRVKGILSVMRAGEVSTAGLSLVPVAPGEADFRVVDYLVCQGRGRLVLPAPIRIIVSEEAVAFSVRTTLPLKETVEWFKGETVMLNLWVTNTGIVDIDEAEVKFIGVQASVMPFRLPIRKGECRSIDIQVRLLGVLKEDLLKFSVIGAALGSPSVSEVAIEQRVLLLPAIRIASVTPLSSVRPLAERDASLIYLCVELENASNHELSYQIQFTKSPERLSRVPEVLNEIPRVGILPGNDGVAFILGVERQLLIDAAGSLEKTNQRLATVFRLEQEETSQRLTAERRAEIVRLLGITVFLEDSITLNWKSGKSRKGGLPQDSALPATEILNELVVIHPDASLSFTGYSDGHLPLDTKVELAVSYTGPSVVRSYLELGSYLDPRYGVAWEGTLSGRKAEENEFRYVLCFTVPGTFDFQVQYQTDDGTAGKSNVSVCVSEELDSPADESGHD